MCGEANVGEKSDVEAEFNTDMQPHEYRQGYQPNAVAKPWKQ